MAGNDINAEAGAILQLVEQAEERANECAAFTKKLKNALSRAKKALATKPAVASEVSKLICALRALPADPEKVSPAHLAQVLEDRLRALDAHGRQAFPRNLRDACEAAQLDFVILPDGFGVGPFYIVPDWSKETASFQYAKVDVTNTVVLNATTIVEQATSFRGTLLEEPVDVKKFSEQLQETMRVALARQGKRAGEELRVELPLVYREMVFVRESAARRRSRQTTEYAVQRFVVELKQFIQSDENMQSDHQFRLETAVIENTKNPRKSIFIPRDLERGYGEGSYYQAIVFR